MLYGRRIVKQRPLVDLQWPGSLPASCRLSRLGFNSPNHLLSLTTISVPMRAKTIPCGDANCLVPGLAAAARKQTPCMRASEMQADFGRPLYTGADVELL